MRLSVSRLSRTLALGCLVVSGWLAAPAQGQCLGPGFEQYMSEADMTALIVESQSTAYGQGLFWEARKDGRRLSILGTMHLPDARLDLIATAARPLLAEADLMLVEATAEDQLAIQRHIAENPELITITEGPSLLDRLDPDIWAAIVTAAEARGIPGFMAARFQPWFLSMSLAIPPCAMSAMAAGAEGFDNLLIGTAPDGLEIRALESWETVFDILRDGTFDEQLDALLIGIIEPAIQDALIVSMLDAYFAGDTARAWQINRYLAPHVPGLTAEEFDAEFAQMTEILLDQRNRDWIPVIEEASAEHAHVVVAFGAAHLVGDQGVLALLAERGWTIERLD